MANSIGKAKVTWNCNNLWLGWYSFMHEFYKSFRSVWKCWVIPNNTSTY